MSLKRPLFTAAFVTALVSFPEIPTEAQAPKFNPGCTLPFDSIAEKREIDDKCAVEGEGKSKRALEQNRAKNNFCESRQPQLATYNTFFRLHQRAKALKFSMGGPSSPLEDRTPYQNIYKSTEGDVLGESDVVRHAGFVVDAHYSNADGKGENVNCNTKGEEWNDIHIHVARTRNEDNFCHTVVVEISPHFRPSSWTRITEIEFDRPLRFTGTLFFDASHHACDGGDPETTNTPRVSSWEIHPVYAIDVCRNKTLQACKANAPANSKTWVRLDRWVGEEEEEEHTGQM